MGYVFRQIDGLKRLIAYVAEVDYALAILRFAKEHGLPHVCIHLVFDDRSTTPGSAQTMLEGLEHKMDRVELGVIASGVGRRYALDRDRDYGERTKLAYDALVYGRGRSAILTE